MNVCANCGITVEQDDLYPDSKWCYPCVQDTLITQKYEEQAPVRKEIIDAPSAEWLAR